MTDTGTTVGLLHPGNMGAAIARQLRRHGTEVLWCPTGRSRTTIQRAQTAGLQPVTDLGTLLKHATLILSLCPPAAATSVGEAVAEHGVAGRIYVEANAITPRRVARISKMLPDSETVDGAVIGSPPVGGKETRLYLAGARGPVAVLERLFAGTDVLVCTLGEEIGRASALKLAYSGYQKASRVLAALSYGAAKAHGVDEELLRVAGRRSGSYLAETGYIPKTAARAWRWGPEMDEAAELFAEAGLPDEVMRAVASVLARWDGARDGDLGVAQALALIQADDGERPTSQD